MNRTPFSGKGVLFCILVTGLTIYSAKARSNTDSSITGTTNSIPTRTGSFNNSFKTIFGGVKDDYGNSMVIATDCGLVVAGQTTSWGQGLNDGMITKIDQSGNIVWSRSVGGTLDEFFVKILRTPDDNYIACGMHGDPNSAAFQGGFSWLVKTDPNGNIIWNYYYTDATSNGNYARDICQTSDGSIVTCGGYGNLVNAAGYQMMVANYTPAGQPAWAKLYAAGLNVETGRKSIIILPDQNLLAACYTEDGSRVRTAILTKINAANGAIIWSKAYKVNNSSTWFDQVNFNDNHLYLNTFVLAPNRIDIQEHLLTISPDGSVESSIRVKLPNEAVAKIFPLDDQSMLIASDDHSNPDYLVLSKINPNGGAYWTKKYELSFLVSPSDIALLSDSNLIICGTNLPGFATNPGAAYREAFIIKTDFEGNQTSCPVINSNIETEASVAVVTDFIWPQTTDLRLTTTIPSDQSIPITPSQDKVCGVSPGCRISNIIGMDSVCAGTGTQQYAINLSGTCNFQMEWNVNPADADVLSKTDSTISLQFKHTGRVSITAGTGTACSASNKTMDVYVLEGPKSDIGKEAFLCGTTPLTLQAPAGQTSYLWQDGSTGSSYTTTQPGRYWVQVTDANNCVTRDTADVVVKDCTKNIYFPNAFTPGNDQLNDIYRPKVFGHVLEFHMRIYDRLGRLIFESKDPNIGWDGTFQGRMQPTASFIWYAIYRFAGEGEGTKMQKGTVTLIR